jgi:hypothetical protein
MVFQSLARTKFQSNATFRIWSVFKFLLLTGNLGFYLQMYEVPFPSPSRPRVLVQLGIDMVSFESHDDSQIPLSGATFVGNGLAVVMNSLK